MRRAFRGGGATGTAIRPAHAALAEIYATLAFHGEMAADSSVEKAKVSVARALDLDADLADAHNTLAWMRFFYDWDWPGAEREFQRAIALNPSHASARQLYTLGLTSRGRFDEAVAQSDTAVDLDPMAYMISAERGAVLYCSRRYDEAIRHARRALAANPDAAAVRGVLGSALAARGQYSEAVAEFEKSAAVFGRIWYVVARMGHAYVGLGRVEEARGLLSELEAGQDKGDVAPVHLALLYTALGEKDRAFEALSRGCDRHDGDVVFLGVEPLLESASDGPSFRGSPEARAPRRLTGGGWRQASTDCGRRLARGRAAHLTKTRSRNLSGA